MNNNIQSLRAVAALAVMLFHSLAFYKDLVGVPMPFDRVLFYGFAGVDIFFVISGYVIAMTTAGQPRGLAGAMRFIERRFFRIYLGYWPILALACVYYFFFDPHRVDKIVVFDTLFLTTTDISKLLVGQAWTLAYELFFYGLFAVLLLGFEPKLRVRLLAAHFILAALFSVWAGDAANSGWLAVRPFVMEFIGGALFFHFGDRLRCRTALIVDLVLTALFCYLGIELDARSGLVRVVFFGGTGLGLLAAAVILRNCGHNTSSMLASLGSASYTLYLCHYTLLEIFAALVRGWFPTGRELLPTSLAFAALLALILLFSLAYYVQVERPLYQRVCARGRWRLSTYLAKPSSVRVE